MAITTRAILRQKLSELIGDYQSLTTSGTGSSTTIVDTDLAGLTGGGDTDAFLNFWAMMTSGAASGEWRRVSAYNSSTTTLTVASAFSATTGNLSTFELHRFEPADLHAALQRAAEELFPFLYLPIRSEVLVVDSWLLNSDFQTGTFTNWTQVGAGAAFTAETTIKIQGSQSAKIVAGGGAAGQLTQAPHIAVQEMTGKTATLKCWVYATAASTARIRLDWDGANFANSSYHTGADQWELLSISAAIPATATQVKAICEVAASGTGYFDAAYLTIDGAPINRYTLPTSILVGPHYVSEQYSENHLDGPYYPMRNRPITGRRIRLEGMGNLTIPATDTATIEVGVPRTDLVVTVAAGKLMRMLASRAGSQDRTRYLDEAVRFAVDAEALKRQPGVRMPRLGVKAQPQIWHIEEDADGRYLVLDRQRAGAAGIGFSTLF